MSSSSTLDVPIPDAALAERKRKRRNIIIAVLVVAWLILTAYLLSLMEFGPGDRIGVDPARPGVDVGGGIYVHEPFLGYHDWPRFSEIYVLLTGIAMYGWYGWTSWKQRRVRPMLVMLVVATCLAPLFDPLISWAAYTAYDPRLLHVPETWPLYDLLPSVQPLASLPGYAMFFVDSVVPGLWLHQWLTRRADATAFISRRPKLTLFLLVGAFAFVFDVVQGYVATRLEIIHYSQIATAALRPGTTWQTNLVWEPLLCFFLFGVAALTVYEDKDGNTMAARFKSMRHRPIAREFVVSLVVLSLATGAYTGIFSLVRISGAATNVACPWPYQDTKVYDPDGLYAEKCQQQLESSNAR